ncbi:MAG TPA: hypothetical protein VJM12_17720 [Pyrinomonadaceae bacterium]|nr:hypothetical protein [Pyrinomonadaceae bacterium]
MSSADISPKVHIGEVVRNAVVFHPGKEATVDADSLIETVAHFFSYLDEHRIEYVLVGGIALLKYVEGRNTEDIDLIMAVSSLRQLPELHIESRDVDFARGHFRNLKVDVRLTSNPVFDEVRKCHAVMQRFVEQDIPCATVEGLILLKLYALPSLYRQGNFTRVGLYENDVATLIQTYSPSLKPLVDKLSSYLNKSDLSQVQEILREIERRIRRFETQR